MITTIFSKSQPVNYIIIAVVFTLFFSLFQIQNENWKSMQIIGLNFLMFLLLSVGILLSNFIGNKNNLQKSSSYSILFHVLFLLLIPDIFNDFNTIIANVLILFSIRRLLSLDSKSNVKQKILDASILIFTACLFKFWAILFILLVFSAIIFHAPRDYRNWIVPYIALGACSITFIFFSVLFRPQLINTFWNNKVINLNFDYFTNSFQNLSISFYASLTALFIANLAIKYSRKPLNSHPHYKILLLTVMLGILFYVFSPNKNNGLLVFTFAPMSILAANFFDTSETKWIKESTAIIIVLVSIICFYGQVYS